MLQVTNLSIYHQKDLCPLVDKLTFSLQAGDKLAIIGEEGTGKSSLMVYLANPNHLSEYALIEGSFHCSASRIAYLRQEATETELNSHLTDLLYKDIDYAQFDFNQFYQLANQLHLDLDKLENQHLTLGQLSGGERLKCRLIKLLAQEPDLLLLDEPSSDLDISSLNWLQDFLTKTPLTTIFISHDQRLLEALATKIIHLERLHHKKAARSTFSSLDYRTYLQERQQQFQKQDQLAKKERQEQKQRLEKLGQVKSSLHYQLNHTKNATAGRLLAKKMKAVLSQEKRYKREEESFHDFSVQDDSIKLSLNQITPLPSSKVLLHQEYRLKSGEKLSLYLQGQDKIAIIGSNGSGKTSLMRQIADDLAQKRGFKLTYIPQDLTESYEGTITAHDFLSQLVASEQVRTLLANLQFSRQEIHHPIAELSGGQKVKVFLAHAVLNNSQVLLLDEPTRHLSPSSQDEWQSILQTYPGAVVLISHDRHLLDNLNWETIDLGTE